MKPAEDVQPTIALIVELARGARMNLLFAGADLRGLNFSRGWLIGFHVGHRSARPTDGPRLVHIRALLNSCILAAGNGPFASLPGCFLSRAKGRGHSSR